MKRYIRRGMYKGKVYEFTHWNKDTNKVWSDDIPNGPNIPDGKWVRVESVKWIDEGGKK